MNLNNIHNLNKVHKIQQDFIDILSVLEKKHILDLEYKQKNEEFWNSISEIITNGEVKS